MNKYRFRPASGASAVAAIAFVAFVMLAMSAAAQDISQATLRVTTRLSAQAPLDEAYWAASLDRAIAHSARVIEVWRADAGSPVPRKNGHIITVEVTAEVLADGVKAAWRLIDPVDGSIFAEGVEESSVPSARILDETYWISLVEALERWDTLIIEAEPGTRIEGFGDDPVYIDSSGTAMILVEQPKIYRWLATRNGMISMTGILSLPNRNVPLKIALQPLNRWAIEAALRLAFFPELRAYYSLVQDKLFVRFGFSQSLWAFRFAEEEDELFTSAYGGRFDPNLGYGVYLAGLHHKLRPYLVMDLSLRLLHTNEAFLYFDPSASFRLTPSVGLDLVFTPHASGFLEAGGDLIGEFDEKFGSFNGRIGTRIRF